MKNALASTMTTLPEQLRRSLTWDRGKELSQHAAFKVETGILVYFADPQSPWQRGTNENTHGLLRQYFPKGTDLSRWNAEEIGAVANTLNSRPRKTLGWTTPAEAFNHAAQRTSRSSRPRAAAAPSAMKRCTIGPGAPARSSTSWSPGRASDHAHSPSPHPMSQTADPACRRLHTGRS
jgi:hypothetical protein